MKPKVLEGKQNIESQLNKSPGHFIEEQLTTLVLKEWNEFNRMACKVNTMWTCKNCDYRHYRKAYVMNHIEAKHASEKFPGYNCMICCERVKSRINFLVHVTKCQRNNSVKLKG